MRINKYLAQKGYSTRKGADKLIEDNQVFINGVRAVLGDKVLENDLVEVKQSKKAHSYLYFAYNKPRGVMTHSASKGEREIKDISPIKGVFPVGRLDKDSHGLIILTNDGRITDRLLNPIHTHSKEYLVELDKPINARFKFLMEKGVSIEGYTTKRCEVDILSSNTFRIVLSEGKKHQIRRMCAALGYTVIDLKRTKVLNIELGKLKSGQHRSITGLELETFLKTLGL